MIKQIDDNYFINENGVVTDTNGNPIRMGTKPDGTLYVMIHGNMIPIELLVAEAFLEKNNDENKKYIHHKDNDIYHNHYLNLEWSDKKDIDEKYSDINRLSAKNAHFTFSTKFNPYVIYNEDERIICNNRAEAAATIHYELISLKNMVGNGRIIDKGPYKGYQIRRANTPIKIKNYHSSII